MDEEQIYAFAPLRNNGRGKEAKGKKRGRLSAEQKKEEEEEREGKEEEKREKGKKRVMEKE